MLALADIQSLRYMRANETVLSATIFLLYKSGL